jgi:hypothetical protein
MPRAKLSDEERLNRKRARDRERYNNKKSGIETTKCKPTVHYQETSSEEADDNEESVAHSDNEELEQYINNIVDAKMKKRVPLKSTNVSNIAWLTPLLPIMIPLVRSLTMLGFKYGSELLTDQKKKSPVLLPEKSVVFEEEPQCLSIFP